MSTPIESPKIPQDEVLSKVVGGRRRFVRGLGIAVPAVITAHSPSALAAKQCFAPSADASIALLNSRPDRNKISCDGGSPGFWKKAAKRGHDHHNSWIAVFGADTGDINPDDPYEGISSPQFSDFFSGGFTEKMHQVLEFNDSVMYGQLARHLVAAYCNFKIGWVPSVDPNEVLSFADLQEMWNGRNYSYEPTAGVSWGAEEIVKYLESTYTRD